MADTRGLLERITAFRERLERTPQLLPAVSEEPPPAVVARSASDGLMPSRLTARAHRLLLDTRKLVEHQKKLADDDVMSLLLRQAVDVPLAAADPLARYHRASVSLTESALRMVRTFPPAGEQQLWACDGLEAVLGALNTRLGILDYALNQRRADARRIGRLSGLLVAIHAGQPVELDSFADIAEDILDEARQAARVRWLAVSPDAPEADSELHGVARFVAAHALNVAQVLARLVPHDFEWATKPAVPLIAAMVMDVGMLAVPAAVLAKKGELTFEERSLIEGHPRRGALLLKRALPETGPLADVVQAHHERIDGTGYPNGLKAEDVPQLAKFLAAADQYAARVADRPHRPGVDPRTALTDTLLAAEQGQLDRDFTEYLLNLSFYPVGTVVELTDGRLAVVAAVHANRANLRASARPVVAVLTDADGAALPRAEFIDLAAADRGGIVRAVPAGERKQRLGDSYPDLCG